MRKGCHPPTEEGSREGAVPLPRKVLHFKNENGVLFCIYRTNMLLLLDAADNCYNAAVHWPIWSRPTSSSCGTTSRRCHDDKKYLIAESESASVAPIHQQFWPESSTRLGRTSISASL